MPEGATALARRTPLAAFSLGAAAGILLGTVLIWIAAWSVIDWLPNEKTTASGVAVVVAFAAALRGELATVVNVIVAIPISVALHLLIYYLPIVILMQAPFTRHLFRDFLQIMMEIMPWHAAGILAAAILNHLFHNKKDPA